MASFIVKGHDFHAVEMVSELAVGLRWIVVLNFFKPKSQQFGV